MIKHFTLAYAGRAIPVMLGDDGILRNGAGRAVCGRCGKPVQRNYEWWRHALTDDYLGGCWWGKPRLQPDEMFWTDHLRVLPGEIDRQIDAAMKRKQQMLLTPREVEQVEAALDTPTTPIPELADAIRRARTDIETED